jgi:glutathione S-transferase
VILQGSRITVYSGALFNIFEKKERKMSALVQEQSAPLKLYAFPLSQPSRSLLMILDDAEIPYEFHHVNILKGEQKSPEFLALNPAGVVPAIDDNGFGLGESGDIIQYLADTRDLKHLYPADPKVRARANFWIHWNHTNTRASTTKFLRPFLHGQPITEQDRESYGKSLQFLNDHLAKSERPFVAGTDAPTVADLILAPELDQLTWLPGVIDYSAYPHVERYLQSLRTGIKSYAARSDPAKELLENFLKAHGR